MQEGVLSKLRLQPLAERLEIVPPVGWTLRKPRLVGQKLVTNGEKLQQRVYWRELAVQA